MRVDVKPELLKWACDRAGMDMQSLAAKEPFKKLPHWLSGETKPTIKQLEKFAKATRTPFGYFFLTEPPEEKIPIPDLRTVANREIARPSPGLLETIFICQQRQEWYRDYARSTGAESLDFAGSLTTSVSIEEAANAIRDRIGFNLDQRRRFSSWTQALRAFIHLADQAGILIMVSGIVGSNTRRSLNVEEFRGFALSDDLAPLIFINGKDSKAAQMFTLAHELAHIWLGTSALSDAAPNSKPSDTLEEWCNCVAAELLVPLDTLRLEYEPDNPLPDEVQRLARQFKVSSLVALRRIHDAGFLNREDFWQAYNAEIDKIKAVRTSGGGDFYRSLKVRVGRRLAKAIVVSTLEGHTLYTEAFQMLGVKKQQTFRDLTADLGVMG